MSYENPWLYNNEIIDSEVLDSYTGFVYNITNLTNNKKYIGKKLLKFKRSKIVKGKRKRTLIESDWKSYYGSNKELQADVELLGLHNFKREILRLCKTKGECNYQEAKLQFSLDVLEDLNYYNSWIAVKVSRSHLPKPS
jgi:hypothetical protein